MVRGSSSKKMLLSALFATSLALEQQPLQRIEKTIIHRGNPLTAEFGRYVTDLMDEWKVPGLSVAVIDGDEVYSQVSLKCRSQKQNLV